MISEWIGRNSGLEEESDDFLDEALESLYKFEFCWTMPYFKILMRIQIIS